MPAPASAAGRSASSTHPVADHRVPAAAARPASWSTRSSWPAETPPMFTASSPASAAASTTSSTPLPG
ncbi:hypothetical protein [Ornithinimicrobium kibberense]|uniref:hypothetical protein n=1 Tax=Ornithinimicrobium kibberense TaxID=282060 RepID=UPI00360E10D0